MASNAHSRRCVVHNRILQILQMAGNAIDGTGFQAIQLVAYLLLLGSILTPPFTWYDVLIIEFSVVLIIWSARNRWRLQKECCGILKAMDFKVPKPE
jgi:hypothetical protein